MTQFFAKDYTGGAFELFGSAHLVALALVLLINLVIVASRKRFTDLGKKRFRFGLAALLVINELAFHLWNYSIGQWTIQTMLPLHLCSVLVWVSAYMLLTRSYSIYEFAYFLGIGGAIQALLTPDAGIYGFPHFRFFQTIISHGAIVTAAIYMTLVEGYRPYWSSLVRVAIWGNIYMAAVGIVNWLVGSNYLFIARKPDTASLIDMLGPWPWYILSLEVVAILMCLALYLPYALRDRRIKAAQ
ncbi:MAG TPA: TIGR02206 family membrane protein [Anaerolineales bacterium]